MTLVRITFLSLLFFSINQLAAQTDFRPGYVITNNEDTLHGFIDYRGDTRNSRICNFKEKMDSLKVQTFHPGDIAGYRFENSKYYVSKSVKINQQKTSLFLEFLVNGIADLYFCKEGTISHYFLEKKDGQLLELSNDEVEIRKEGKIFLKHTKQYIGTLKYAFEDCPRLFPMINDLTLGTKSLISITKKYHNYVCDGEKCIVYEKQLPSFKVTFAPFASMNGSFLNIKNAGRCYRNMDYQMSSFPAVGLQMNSSLPRANEKLSLLLSGEIGKNYFYGKNNYYSYLEEVHLHSTVFSAKGGLRYTYPTGKIRPIITLGVNTQTLLDKNGKRVEDKVENNTVTSYEYNENIMTDLYFGYNLDLGINYLISKRNTAFLTFGYSTSAAENKNHGIENYLERQASPLTIEIRTINLSAGIYF